MIASLLYVNLSREAKTATDTCRADRRALEVLDRCPVGAWVLVDIGRRRFLAEDVARILCTHDHRLIIQVQGTIPEAVQNLVHAARNGEWVIS